MNNYNVNNNYNNNKHIIMLKDRDVEVLYAIEFSCSSETNQTTKGKEKRDKYSDFIFDVDRRHPGFPIKVALIVGIKADFLEELNNAPPPTCKQNSKILLEASLGRLHPFWKQYLEMSSRSPVLVQNRCFMTS